MKIIPALDVYKNKFIRLKKGKYSKKFLKRKKISKFINFFLINNHKLINLINLSGAESGKIKNEGFINKIIKSLLKKNIKFNIGGGIRSNKSIAKYLNKGASGIILGTRILNDIKFLKNILKIYKDKIIVSLDLNKFKIMISGWKKKSKYSFLEYIDILKKYKNKIIITNIKRDGSLKGVEKKFIKKIKSIVKKNIFKKIIFSGGFKGGSDFNFLKKMKVYRYISGSYFYRII
ncbi:HisA/HisF-related TIM barrel protein [Candidatus Vidania fulgoroideorum]